MLLEKILGFLSIGIIPFMGYVVYRHAPSDVRRDDIVRTKGRISESRDLLSTLRDLCKEEKDRELRAKGQSEGQARCDVLG